jgi:hypothetical protein
MSDDWFANKHVRFGMLLLATGWLALELKRQSTWGTVLAAGMFALAAFEVFFNKRD